MLVRVKKSPPPATTVNNNTDEDAGKEGEGEGRMQAPRAWGGDLCSQWETGLTEKQKNSTL